MKERYRQLYNSTEIQQRIGLMASEITAKYNGDDEEFGDSPLFIALLRGGMPFASRLMFEMTRQAPEFHPELDYMMTSRYADRITPNAETKILKDLTPSTKIEDRRVILLDDVFDIGETAKTVREHLIGLGARSVELAVLIEKDIARTTEVMPDYVGFKAPDKWLVGMGMDDGLVAKESYRWADGVWAVEQEEPQFQHATLAS